MISDYACYMNGEVVTLDSGEWVKNAGQFNKLEKIPNTAELATFTKNIFHEINIMKYIA